MSISDVIVVVENKCDMFWRVDVTRGTQKKKSSKSVHKQKIGRGRGEPPNLKDVNIPRVKLYKITSIQIETNDPGQLSDD